MEPTQVKGQRRVIGAVFALISLPPLGAGVEAVAFHFQNRNSGSIVSSSELREYLLHVPESYDASRPTPLVLSLHGAGGWPAQQRDVSEWNETADEHGFIVAYPAALEGRSLRVWRLGLGRGLARDVRFISDLIDELEKTHNIDPRRIYANGLSAGGGMSFALSCTLSERIAAIGTVAAARVLPWSWCTHQRSMPMIAFHGTADSIVPYEGGETWIGPHTFPGVEEWMANWARRNGCGSDPVEATMAADVTRRSYEGCDGNAGVVLYTIHDGGHTWPGGKPLPEWFVGPTSRNVDATAQMWEFFEERRLARSQHD